MSKVERLCSRLPALDSLVVATWSVVFWFEDEAPEVDGTRRVSPRPARPDAANPRWKHTCGWDGHELEGMDYVQVSTHERVCRFHHPQFVDWVAESSKRMFRFELDADM